MGSDKEENKEEGAEQGLIAARRSFITSESANRARAALEPYGRPEEGLESAIRNFLVDFFHATRQRDGVAIEADELKIIVDEAAELYSVEREFNKNHDSELAKLLGHASKEEYQAWLKAASKSKEKKGEDE